MPLSVEQGNCTDGVVALAVEPTHCGNLNGFESVRVQIFGPSIDEMATCEHVSGPNDMEMDIGRTKAQPSHTWNQK